MTIMNPVHTGPRLLSGGTERRGTSLVTIAAIGAVAAFGGGGLIFYSLSNRPTTAISAGYSPIVDDFKALESLQAPPTATGQPGAQ